MNIATDVYAWMWLVKLIIVLAFLVWMIPDVKHLVFAEAKDALKSSRKVRNILLKGSVCLLALLALFMFFGPGETAPDVAAADDGHRKAVEARPAPLSESAIKEEAEAKKDPYLKAVDASPEADRKAADEYLKKALERSRK